MNKFVLTLVLTIGSIAMAGIVNFQTSIASNDTGQLPSEQSRVSASIVDDRDAKFQKLAAVASSQGSVRVLVRLNVSFTPKDTLDRSRSILQRSEISRLQSDLLSDLRRFETVLIHQFEDVPFLILTVDETALRQLELNAMVADIFEDRSTTPQPGDDAMAAEIRKLTDRSTDGLLEEILADGAVKLDVEGRFQNVPVAVVESNGDVSTGCVASIDEANGFLGRDLETGERRPASRDAHDHHGQTDIGHNMTADEAKFYRDLINMAVKNGMLSPDASNFEIINNDGANEGLNDPLTVAPVGGNPGTTLGQQRLNVMVAAANIWSAFLDSGVTIAVRAQFDPLSCNSNSAVLGSAGAWTYFRDFQNAGLAGTWHPVALANKQAGVDLSANPDINANFNSNLGNAGCLTGVPFYLGLDNNAPGNTVNLLATVLHEMGHGLGFISIVNGSTGALANGFPDVYTTNMFDRTQNKTWNEMTNAERQASAINSNNVLWDGSNVKTASGFLTNGRDAATGRVELFTPNPFQSGSSISHFNSRAFPNLLMEPASSPGVPLTLDLTRQQMRDIGWYRDANNDLTPDTITNVQPSGSTIVIGSSITISWTNTINFDRNVTIEMSTDGGTTFPTLIASNITNTGSHAFVVPNNPNSQVRFRVREHDFVAPLGTSAENVSIAVSTPTPTATPTPVSSPTPTPTPTETPTPVVGRAVADFDGDGRTDVSVYRDDPGVWFWQNSSNGGTFAAGFGIPGDTIVPGDYDGDGKADLALYRSSTGTWWVNRSGSGNVSATGFGTATDIPAQGDYDGDGKTDIAIYRPTTGEWWLNQTTAGVAVISFGLNGDKPVPGDYDGDGKTDIAIYRPSTGQWFLRQSTAGVTAISWGIAEDKVVPGDYDGDGRTDVGLYRPSTGQWFIIRSTLGVFVDSWGLGTDIPVPGDYDGDGRADITVYRPSEGGWFRKNSSNGQIIAISYGIPGDKPIPANYVPIQ